MKQVIVFVVLVFCMIFSLSATTYKVVSQTAEINETLGLGKYQTVVQAGHNELNRFTLHRVVKLDKHLKPLPVSRLKGAFMLLPGGGSNFDIYMLGPDGSSLATFLALKGIDVYGYSPRSNGIVSGYCDSHDCSPMANWGIATYLEDIEYLRKQIARVHFSRPVVGGLSLGAILSIAAVNEKPNAYAGAVFWDGTLYYNSPIQEMFTETCAGFQSLLESGQYYDNQSYTFLKATTSLYRFDPEGASPFAPGFSNREFYLYMLTTPNDPPVAEAPGYTYAAGNMSEGLFYVDEDLLFRFAMQMNDYEPIALIRDYICGFAGARTFTNKLAKFKAPIFSLQAGLGFGVYAEDNLAFFKNADITRLLLPNFGHADIGAPKNYENIICKPIWYWLKDNILPVWERE